MTKRVLRNGELAEWPGFRSRLSAVNHVTRLELRGWLSRRVPQWDKRRRTVEILLHQERTSRPGVGWDEVME